MAEGPRAHDDHGQALAVATELHAGGDSARALELLPDLVAARPDDIAVRLLLARCLATAGAPAVALAAADAAVACDPMSWEAHALLARAALVVDPERAAAAADRAVQLAPHEPEAVRIRTAVQSARTEGPPPDEGTRRRPAGGFTAALGLRPTLPTTDLASTEPRPVPRLPAALDPSRVPPADRPIPAGSPPNPLLAPAASLAPPNPPAPTPPPGAPAPPISSAPPAPPVAPQAVPVAPLTSPVPTPQPGAPAPSLAPLPLAPAAPLAPSRTRLHPGAVAPLDPLAPTPQPGAATPLGSPGLGLAAGGSVAPVEHREPPVPRALGGVGLAGAADDTGSSTDDRIGPARLTIRVIGLALWLLVGFRFGVQGIGGPVGIGLFLAVVAWVAFLARRLTDR